MKHHLLFVGLLGICSTAFAQKDIKESCSPAEPLVIDGQVTEWRTEWSLDPDGKFIYNVCNDDSNLYVRIQISDVITQRKIGLFGFTLWMDPTGKKKRDLGLKYPVGAHQGQQPLPELGKDAKKGDLERNLIQDVEGLELIGLAKDNIFSTRAGLMNGLQMAIIYTPDGTYQYEVKIPFKAFKIKPADVKTMGIGFETGRHIPSNKAPQNRSGASPGSIAAQQSGASSAYYGMAMMGNYGAMSAPTRMWTAVKLH